MSTKLEDIAFNPEKVADELELSDKQRKFCDYYVFLTGLDAEKAVKLAGYEIKYPEKMENLSEDEVETYKNYQYKRIGRNQLNNPKVLKYIKAVRDNLDDMLIVDQLWVKQKLKTMAENGSERTQLEATKLLGQTMSMFTEVQRQETADDPAAIAREAFKRRQQGKVNVVEFKKVENE